MRPRLVFRSGTLLFVLLGLGTPLLAQAPSGLAASVVPPEATKAARPASGAANPAQDRPVTFSLVSVPLPVALEEIARQAGLTLGYPADILPEGARVSLNVQRRPAVQVLAEALRETGLEARVLPGGQVTLGRIAAPARPQTGTVAGRVTDATTGAPLSGASIRIDGTRRGALAGSDGRYRLERVPAGRHLVRASMIGYSAEAARRDVVADQTVSADFALSLSALPLDEVVVTGTVVPTEVRALPTPISVVTAEAIQRQNLARVDQVFRGQVPGAIAWDQGAADHYSSIVVRGINSFQTNALKTYVDGIELSSSSFALIDPHSIERIEIIRGPEASTIYGSDASGGVMQIFTRQGRPTAGRPELSAKLAIGAIQSPYVSDPVLRQDHNVTLSGGDEGFGYNLGASYSETGEWLPEYRSESPSGYAGARMVQGPLTFSLSARARTKTFGVTQSPAAVATGYTPFSAPVNLSSRNAQQTYGAFLGYAVGDAWTHSLTIGVDQGQTEVTRDRPRLTTPADTFLSITNSAHGKTSLAYNTTYDARLGRAVAAHLTAGADRFERWSNAAIVNRALTTRGTIATPAGIPPIATRNRISNTGYFGQAQFGFGNALFLTAGLRADRNDGFGAEFGTALAPRVGVAYTHELGALSAKVRGAYGEGIRAPLPTQRDARRSVSSVQLANPELGPERQVGGDAGLELHFGRRASLAATYYDQTAIDLIDFVLVDASTAPPSYQFQNVGRIKNRGWELQGQLSHGIAALRATYSLTSSTVETLAPGYSGDLEVGDQAPLVPRRTGGATLALSPGRGTTLHAALTYVGTWTSYDYVDLFGFYYGGEPFRGSMRDYWRSYPSFVKANVGASRALRRGLEAFINIENVGNSTPIEQNDLFPTYGRATTVGARVRY